MLSYSKLLIFNEKRIIPYQGNVELYLLINFKLQLALHQASIHFQLLEAYCASISIRKRAKLFHLGTLLSINISQQL